MGLSPSSNLEVDSYLGFKQPFDQTLGYEVGMIHYSYPQLDTLDSQEFFGGLTLLGSRFGAGTREQVAEEGEGKPQQPPLAAE